MIPVQKSIIEVKHINIITYMRLTSTWDISSRTITEVKQCRARLVLAWETPVLNTIANH